MTEAEIRARPTLYKGIKMRSRLEADYAANLDGLGWRWEYEPECFANDAGQWLPDFGLTGAPADDKPTAIFDEVKPAGPLIEQAPGSAEFTEHVDKMLRRMAVAWDSRPDATLRLVFWQYGGPAYLLLFCVRRGSPWLAYFDAQPMEMIWPGLHQYVKSKPLAGVNEEIARRWRGLAGKTASHTWPGALSDGVLAVYADSVAWAEKVRHAENQLVLALNLILGSETVRKISVQLDAVS